MIDKLLSESAVKRFKTLIANSESVVMTCHVRPDGDAIGSTLGFWHAIRKLYPEKHVAVVIPDQAPRSLSFLPGSKELIPYSKYPDYGHKLVTEAALIICCDFNTATRQDALAPEVQNSSAAKVLVDHHQEPESFADLIFSYPDMSSTCELAFRLMAAMGWYADMDRDCAECLLCGMVTDTRNFTVNCSHPDIYVILEKLLEKGVDKQKIVKEALLTKSLGAVRLMAYAIDKKMEIIPEHHGAVITLDREELKHFGYERGDTEGLVNTPLEIRGVVYSFFLREDADCIKVSARSENDFPVSKVCADLFGGGGHIQAAGGEFHGTLEECRRILLESLPNYDCYLPSQVEKIS